MKLTDEQLERAQEKVLGWMFHTSEHETNTIQIGREVVGQLSDLLENCREYKAKMEELTDANQKLADQYNNDIYSAESKLTIAEAKVEEMQKVLDEWENAALIPCDTCGGGGFNGYGTGYNAVCDGCAGNGGYMGRATPEDLIEMIARRMSKGESQ